MEARALDRGTWDWQRETVQVTPNVGRGLLARDLVLQAMGELSVVGN